VAEGAEQCLLTVSVMASLTNCAVDVFLLAQFVKRQDRQA